ncbi:glycoside hydrolase family 88 protein [Alistipes sp.]|uniref:glycoside hydrolase family 88 protein n=1 Tax=Alistipes sp. TaxID=1872444 RepID=UPI0023F09641|nr:glycoside hydrolase family 88 protein [Alistipes sp.]
MKQTLRLVLTFCLLAFIAGDAAAQRIVRKSFARAERQTALLDSLLTSPDLFPASWNTDGTIKTNSARGWISGFFPANIWFLYEYTRDPKWLDMARRRTAPLDTLRRYTKTHDLGFMVGCPCAAAYRLTGEEAYRQLLIDASDALLTRFSPAVGLIRPWDNKNGDPNPYRVIIDNMMNLEMLFTVSKLTGDKRYYDIAVCHADNTLKNHFRPDNSCFHIVCYDAETGRVTGQRGGQGYSAASAWSRGQSWALYGFTMCYRETGDPSYLDRAVKCAEYFINHPRLPEDLVPYWDYDAPGIPDEPRDASAAAITASALLELAKYAPGKEKSYYGTARKILTSLASDRYLIPAGKKCGFLIDHSVGSKPSGSQVDVPIIYGDYYFLEALLRLKNYKTQK